MFNAAMPSSSEGCNSHDGSDDFGSPLSTACCRICFESGADPNLGRLIAPCRCNGTMRFVHSKCLERWRASAANRASYYRCDACLSEYRIQRSAVTKLLLSKTFVHALTCLVCSTGVLLIGALPAWWQSSKRCRCTKLTPAYRCPVHKDPYMHCVRVLMLCHAGSLEDSIKKAVEKIERHRLLTLAPMHIVVTGCRVVAPLLELLYFHGRLHELWYARRGLAKFVVSAILALVISKIQDLRRAARFIGMVTVYRELHDLLQVLCRVVGQRIGERIVEPAE